jgi:CheY-like chemotaxis protein
MAKIIIIDDEEDIRLVLKQVLELEGYDVAVAESGKEGLEILKQEGADLVITDVIMPGMDGVSLTREIREKFRDTRILVISGGGNVPPASYEPGAISTTAFLSSAKNAGADQTMTKPFDRRELMRIIEKLLD